MQLVLRRSHEKEESLGCLFAAANCGDTRRLVKASGAERGAKRPLRVAVSLRTLKGRRRTASPLCLCPSTAATTTRERFGREAPHHRRDYFRPKHAPQRGGTASNYYLTYIMTRLFHRIGRQFMHIVQTSLLKSHS